jgi:hypothetical protein
VALFLGGGPEGRRGRQPLRFRAADLNGISNALRTVHDETYVLRGAVDEPPGINLLLTITPQHCLIESRRGL